ncbi:MAG: dTDP-4-dehydrorhamnose reductase [Bacteroidota bacterium]|nr:dTDP-4-dehydrorhamnose reductase [Bacteroidota bacterium]
MSSQNYTITILVTGANGQLANEIKTISVKFPSYQFLFTTKDELPIENTEALKLFFNKYQIDYCINCAAYTAVDKAESEKEKAFLINADAVGKLAAICNAHQTKLIHISTDYVYDGSKAIALKEEDEVAPLNVYGFSKLKGEELALNKNPSTFIIRTSWVYSSFGNNFVKTMLRLFKEKEEINVIDDQYGSPTYAADLANIILVFIERMQNGETFSGIVNYCNDGVTTWHEFAEAIKQFVKSNCKINPIPTSSYKTAAMRPQYSVLDTSKIKETLHLDIPGWKESLGKCLQVLIKI